MKKKFIKPQILQTVEVILEECVLGPSQEMNSATVDSMGTERKTEDFSASDNAWYISD